MQFATYGGAILLPFAIGKGKLSKVFVVNPYRKSLSSIFVVLLALLCAAYGEQQNESADSKSGSDVHRVCSGLPFSSPMAAPHRRPNWQADAIAEVGTPAKP